MTPPGMETDVKDAQRANADSPMEVTPMGMETEIKEVRE
jgi:hypothetical protein